MKVFNKEKLALQIALCRLYWRDATSDQEDQRELLKFMYKVAERNFPEARDLTSFINSGIGGIGLKPGATNEEVYKMLEVLGYEVA